MDTKPTTEHRKAVIINELARFGIVPSFPPADPTNEAEGVDGDCVCPYLHLHTVPESDPGRHTTRIWLDRPDGNRPEAGGRLMLSCRHTSCQDALWQEVTLPARKSDGTTRSAPPLISTPEVVAARKRSVQAAVAGKERTTVILNDPGTLMTTEADIMRLSPFPMLSSKGNPRPPLTQLLLFLSLFHPDDLVYLGEEGDAKQASHIRPRKDWDAWINHFSTTAAAAEEPHLWPWPGHFTTGSAFREREGGRNNANLQARRFVVCESDKLGKKEQLRVVRAMIADPKIPVAYVLHSGGKSYHVGLRLPNPTNLDLAYLVGVPGSHAPRELTPRRKPERFGGMGFDHATVRDVQPVRIPGPFNPRTGRPQRLLYIDPSMGYDSTPAE
jgi:hypothetical protein